MTRENPNCGTFQKAVTSFVESHERKKFFFKNAFQISLVVCWLEDYFSKQNWPQFIFLLKYACVHVCIYQVKQWQSICKWNVTTPPSSINQDNSSCHVWQQPWRGWFTNLGNELTPPASEICSRELKQLSKLMLLWFNLGKKIKASCISNTSCTTKVNSSNLCSSVKYN